MPSLLKQQRRMTYRYLRYDLQISQTALFLYLGMVSAFSRLCNLLLCSSQSIPYRCFFLYTVDLLVFMFYLQNIVTTLEKFLFALTKLNALYPNIYFVYNLNLIITLYPVRSAAFRSLCVLQIEKQPLFLGINNINKI